MMVKRRKATDIEIKLSSILDKLGLKYVREFRIGVYPVDFYVPELKLSIQADGCWHHGNECCSSGSIKHRQRRQKYRDDACMTYHRYCKISILRIAGCKIKEQERGVEYFIEKSVNSIKRGKKVYERY